MCFCFPTFASILDADWLETSIEGGGIDDVGVKVAVVLPVDEECHDDRDNQAHDHRYDNTHIQSYIICAGGHWGRKRGGGRMGGLERETKDREKNCVLISYNFTPVVFNFLCGL